MDANVLAVVLTGIAAILTAAAALVRAMRTVDGEMRRRNRTLERWREQGEKVIRLMNRHAEDAGLPHGPAIVEARERLDLITNELDGAEEKV